MHLSFELYRVLLPYQMPTRLFDCFIETEKSPPMAGTAPNATGRRVRLRAGSPSPKEASKKEDP